MTIEPLTPQALALFVAQYSIEEDFGKWLLGEARATGWLATHFRTAIVSRGRDGKPRYATAISGDAGFPDWCLARGSRLIFAELKVGRNKPSADQLKWLEALEYIGARRNRSPEVYLWSPPKRDEILRVLE